MLSLGYSPCLMISPSDVPLVIFLGERRRRLMNLAKTGPCQAVIPPPSLPPCKSLLESIFRACKNQLLCRSFPPPGVLRISRLPAYPVHSLPVPFVLIMGTAGVDTACTQVLFPAVLPHPTVQPSRSPLSGLGSRESGPHFFAVFFASPGVFSQTFLFPRPHLRHSVPPPRLNPDRPT